MKEHAQQNNNEIGFLNYNFYDNPYPIYDQLRLSDPIHWSEHRASWFITRYNDVSDCLKDPRLSAQRDKRKILQLPQYQRENVEPLRDFYSNWLLYLDVPDHTRLRKSVNKVFTPAVIQKRITTIGELTYRLVTKLSDRPSFDILHDFASPLAIAVVADTLGIDPEEYEQVKIWSDDIVRFVVGRTSGYEGAIAAQDSFENFSSHLDSVFSAQEVFPGTSVLSYLASAQQEGTISRREAAAIYGNILLDGHEPIANGIANGMFSLFKNPSQMDLLRVDPDLTALATEELLRYESPFPLSAIIANEDIELADKNIRMGQKVMLMLASANRDPEYFDRPDELDITRESSKHITFASGRHYCIGATLARPTLQIAFRSLLDELPTIRLEKQPDWEPLLGVRALTGLPVAV